MKTLANFVKVSLAAGEEKVVTFDLDQRAFSWYNPKAANWQLDNGAYEILVGSSSADIRLNKMIELNWTPERPIKVDQRTYIGDLIKQDKFAEAVKQAGLSDIFSKLADDDDPTAKMFQNMPLRAATTMGVSPEKINKLIEIMNN